jgi:hypothetical protein
MDRMARVNTQKTCCTNSWLSGNVNTSKSDEMVSMPLLTISMQLVSHSHTCISIGSDHLVVIHDSEVGLGSGPWQELAVRRACAEVIKQMKGDKEWIESICDCQAKEKTAQRGGSAPRRSLQVRIQS